MLPHVINFNSRLPEVAAIYASLCKEGALETRIKEHLEICSMDRSLSDLGVDEASLQLLSEEAAKQWTAQFNPVPVDAGALEGIYRSAF